MDDEDVLESDKNEKEPSTQDNISRFLSLPQEVFISRTRAKPIIDYSQSQILISAKHMDTLHSIVKNKDQLAQEKEAKRIERKLIKHERATENKNREKQRKKELMTSKQGWMQTHLKLEQLKKRQKDCTKPNGVQVHVKNKVKSYMIGSKKDMECHAKVPNWEANHFC